MTLSDDPLLQPFQLKHLTLRNRIISTSHAPSFQVEGQPRDRYRLYHEEKAKGGVALTMVGGSTNIAPDSPSVFGQLYAGDNRIIPWFKSLTEGVQQQGAAIMCQITHMGRRTSWDQAHWLPVLAPSRVRERAHRSYPKVMEAEDIQRVVAQFAEAAWRCQQGGFDGIEILAHSHLIGQFLSPAVNQREDDYGGSFENRLRFCIEVVDAIRSVVGSSFIVGVRATGDELNDVGLSPSECILIAKALEATGSIDFLNVLAGAPYDDLGLASWVPPMGMPAAAHLSIAGAIRQNVKLPVLHAGGVADLATARHAIAEGHVDLIGMTRAHLADPHLVSKMTRGEELRIRPCVGLGYCVDRVNQGKDAVCGHNVATGREATLSHIIPRSQLTKKVVIVGGGVAGLEAARICAERGHDTHLFEASNTLGGQMNLANRGMTRRQISGVSDWLNNEVRLLPVNVQLNHYVEAEDITQLNPDVVIIATGAWPDEINIPGAQHAISSWEILGGDVRVSGDVLLFDETGDHAACVCADYLSLQQCSVTLVSPDRLIAQEMGPTNASVVLRDLALKSVNFSCLQELISIELIGNRKAASLRHVLSGDITQHQVDFVVIEHAATPSDDLFFELKSLSFNGGQLDQQALCEHTAPFVSTHPDGLFYLARIGDAVTSRNIHAALYDAMRVCKDI